MSARFTHYVVVKDYQIYDAAMQRREAYRLECSCGWNAPPDHVLPLRFFTTFEDARAERLEHEKQNRKRA
jgi:hypothetical protein